VTSYSKTLSIAGERIGYVAANPSCEGIRALMAGLIMSNRVLGFVNAPALMQRIIVQLQDISVDTEIYKRRRDILMEGLSKAGYAYVKPEGAFYLFCKSPIEDDVRFTGILQRYNILVVPGSGFGAKGYFRLSYTVNENVIRKAFPGFASARESLG
jgi:aspartate aminotransferase